MKNMISIQTKIKASQDETIETLCKVIDSYLKHDVDGDNYTCEQDFEDDIRNMLTRLGFYVLPKKNVENTDKLIAEKQHSQVQRQIPDIAVECLDGVVFLELKYNNQDDKYAADVEKVQDYIKKGVCSVSAVLFLDDREHKGWEKCEKNPRYSYQFQSFAS